jgi:hypothetical protein
MRKLWFLIAALMFLPACTSRNPLDTVPQTPQASTITVTVLNGSALATSVDVFLKGRDSSMTVKTDASGQAIFPISGTGNFEVGLLGQLAQTQKTFLIQVQNGTTVYTVTLQQTGAAFAVSAPSGQGNGYGWNSASKNWTIAYLNNSDLAADLTIDLDPAFPIATSWTAGVSPAFIVAGQSTVFNVVVPQGSQAGTRTFRVRGRKSNGSTLLYADVVIPQEWSFRVRRTYFFDQSGAIQCTAAQTRFLGISATAETIGVPSGAIVVYNPVAIYADGCSICGAVPQSFTGFMGSGSLLFYPGTINGFSLFGILGQAYRTSNLGACSGISQQWIVTASWAIGNTTKITADSILYQLGGGAQSFSFFD